MIKPCGCDEHQNDETVYIHGMPYHRCWLCGDIQPVSIDDESEEEK